MISMIVAHDKNRVIGNKGEIPWDLPVDLYFFKKMTLNEVVVMGSKTYNSILKRNGKPLPNRLNVVLTRKIPDYIAYHKVTVKGEEVIFTRDLDDIDFLKHRNKVIIGGESIYKLFLPKAEMLFITEVQGEFEGDTYFPEVDFSKYELGVSVDTVADIHNKYNTKIRGYNLKM